jgi:hypothetical protein
VAAVDVRLRRAPHGEASDPYVYDAVLRKAPARVAGPDAAQRVGWGRALQTLDELAAVLGDFATRGVRVTAIPHGRLAADIAAAHALNTALRLDDVLAARPREGCRDPEDFHALGAAAGRTVLTTWDAHDASRFEALFLPPGRPAQAVAAAAPPAGAAVRPGVPPAESNDPEGARRSEALVASLREHLRRRLPEYMVPSRILALPRLPLSATGKLDRRALPSPRKPPARIARRGGSPLEEAVRRMVAHALDLPSAGAEDGFSELGGTLPQALRLVYALRDVLGLPVSLHGLVGAGSTAALARLASWPDRSAAPERPGTAAGRARLFCLPAVGCLDLPYAGLRRHPALRGAVSTLRGRALDDRPPAAGPAPGRPPPMPTRSSRRSRTGHTTCSAGGPAA